MYKIFVNILNESSRIKSESIFSDSFVRQIIQRYNFGNVTSIKLCFNLNERTWALFATAYSKVAVHGIDVNSKGFNGNDVQSNRETVRNADDFDETDCGETKFNILYVSNIAIKNSVSLFHQSSKI